MQNKFVIILMLVAWVFYSGCGQAREPVKHTETVSVSTNDSTGENIPVHIQDSSVAPKMLSLKDTVVVKTQEVASPFLKETEQVDSKKPQRAPESQESPLVIKKEDTLRMQKEKTPHMSASPSHAIWNELLKEYVSPAGKVDYKALMGQKLRLQQYIGLLAQQLPQPSWSREERLAYWINAYNAFTVKLILDHYPLKSITDLEEPWKQPFISLGGNTYTLDDIEHKIIRKEFNEPRIHFAVNCAAISCPRLRNGAFLPEKLDAQLDEMARSFINNPEKNRLGVKKAELSKIFEWYGEDFIKRGSLIDYLNRYAQVKLSPDARISFLEYDWRLNGE